MTTLTVALSVTTPDIEAIDGPLTDVAGNAQVVSVDPGAMTKRRGVETSPTVRGGRQTWSQPEKRVLTLRLRIFGSSKADLDANVQTWQNVFSQIRYHTSYVLNGVETEWACDDADWNLVSDTGEGIDPHRLRATPMRQLYEFRIPTDPDPTVGVL